MWMASLGRREFLDTVAAGPSAEIVSTARKFSGQGALRSSPGTIVAFWQDAPEGRNSLPIMAVADESQVRDLLAALNASPNALSPFTAFCRVVNYEQAEAYLARPILRQSAALIEAVALLSLVEVQLLSENQIKARRVSPAAARRTLSFAWGRGIASGLSQVELEALTNHWLEAYGLTNAHGSGDGPASSVRYVLPVLTTVCNLLQNGLPLRPAERLIDAIMNSDAQAKETAWLEASNYSSVDISLVAIESASREERGAYLQRLFKSEPRGQIAEYEAAQGFLATQIAPGSLEHLDIVLSQGGPEAAFWYVLFATLQKPNSILNAFGGLGRRIARDVRDCESIEQSPRADIALDELRILARSNIDELTARIGHYNEIEVELLPTVSATFRFGRPAQSKSNSDEISMLRHWNNRLASDLRHVSSLIDRTLDDFQHAPDVNPDMKKRNRKARY